MSATLFVRHRVNDFGAWRAVYDSVEPLRRHAGCPSGGCTPLRESEPSWQLVRDS